jgi:hypothetical protein
LLAGDDVCWWAPWFKARNKFDKVEREGFDLAKWSAEHTELLDRLVVHLEDLGYHSIRRENANKFLLKGKGALLSGKPDVVAFKGDEVLIADAKSGQRKNADWWQVLIYLFALPLAFHDDGAFRGRSLRGVVVYKPAKAGEPPQLVDVGELTADRRASIVKAIQGIGVGGAEPQPQPSGHECSFCEIPATVCTVRNGEGAAVSVLTSEF